MPPERIAVRPERLPGAVRAAARPGSLRRRLGLDDEAPLVLSRRPRRARQRARAARRGAGAPSTARTSRSSARTTGTGLTAELLALRGPARRWRTACTSSAPVDEPPLDLYGDADVFVARVRARELRHGRGRGGRGGRRRRSSPTAAASPSCSRDRGGARRAVRARPPCATPLARLLGDARAAAHARRRRPRGGARALLGPIAALQEVEIYEQVAVT